MKCDKLSSEFFLEREAAKHKLDLFNEKIIDRITYIRKLIADVFEFEHNCWYVEGAQEGEIGDLDRTLDSETDIYLEVYPQSQSQIIDNNGKIYNLACSFPKRWLFEDFEDELINGKVLYEKFLEEEKAKRKLDKEIRAEKLKEVKNKLTKEEINLLGLK